jgi:hypothetical protein
MVQAFWMTHVHWWRGLAKKGKNHRFNHMDSRLIELYDELTRSGNLFILISTDTGCFWKSRFF